MSTDLLNGLLNVGTCTRFKTDVHRTNMKGEKYHEEISRVYRLTVLNTEEDNERGPPHLDYLQAKVMPSVRRVWCRVGLDNNHNWCRTTPPGSYGLGLSDELPASMH
jgi:hypothetical protein